MNLKRKKESEWVTSEKNAVAKSLSTNAKKC